MSQRKWFDSIRLDWKVVGIGDDPEVTSSTF